MQVVDEQMVLEDLGTYVKGEKVRGWLVLASFLIGSVVEVCYI